jgi:hypothetical protein
MCQTKVVEKFRTYIMFKEFVTGNSTVYEVMWKNDVEWGIS